jgi:hypothetical protein
MHTAWSKSLISRAFDNELVKSQLSPLQSLLEG